MSDTITISRDEYTALTTLVEKLQHELAWLKRQMFGSKSERFIPNDSQLSLDFGVATTETQTETQEVAYSRTVVKKAQGHSRGEMPTHLPFDDVIIEPQEDTEGCTKIGEDVSWEYEYKPGTLFIRRYIRPRYAMPDNQGIITAALPDRPIDKGNFGPGIMATVTNDKYLYHTPLNRQREKFKNEFGVEFAESTLCDIVARTVFWIEAVYKELKSDLLQATYLQADETTIPVLIKAKKGKAHKGYYWVYYDPIRRIVIYEYQKNRSRAGPNAFLKDFSGILQVDGYNGYDELAAQDGISRAACMAHVRRKFEDALKFDAAAAEHALKTIGHWFSVERRAKELEADFAMRLEQRADLAGEFSSFKDWMVQQVSNRLNQDLIRKACEYGIGQWFGFDAYLKDGRVELSNNLVENAIRPIALGRKNYLFKGSEQAAQRGAIIYSVIMTAKGYGWDPYKYIKMLLEELPAEKNAANIRNYLPYIRTPQV